MALFDNLMTQREKAAEQYALPCYFRLERDRENGRHLHLMLRWPDTDRAGSPVWSYMFDTLVDKREVLEALAPTDLTLSLWGRLAMIVGPEPLNALFDDAVKERREKMRAKAAKAKRQAEARQQVTLYFTEKNGRYGLQLQRDSEDEPEWSLSFMGKSERDRLLDWMRWQKPHFLSFLDHAAEHGEEALNERLLEEMFATERRVKKEGKGAGGLRPLRMWRGA